MPRTCSSAATDRFRCLGEGGTSDGPVVRRRVHVVGNPAERAVQNAKRFGGLHHRVDVNELAMAAFAVGHVLEILALAQSIGCRQGWHGFSAGQSHFRGAKLRTQRSRFHSSPRHFEFALCVSFGRRIDARQRA
jgi:hypothetical protein